MLKLPRGINYQKIIKKSPKSRDWQNIPLGRIDRAVKNMPNPIGLLPQEKKILISVYLNESTVRFFKKEANRHHSKYQRMMRAVLERYKEAYT